ncbi:tryptophan--tRNA ligase, partial [Patescibacteria group bacterium]|nr:tryptophan--tRNA ligase [Patescibacteria group bacterium]
MKKTIFSGVQPTGIAHIGNYLGAIKNWVELQNEYNSIFCVVDLHAITVPQDPQKLRKAVLEMAAIYLAAGIDHKKSVVFVQSHLSEHSELAWLLNTITKIPELEWMTQFKDKSEQHKNKVNVGLFDYPVLMAADILLYQTDAVPVGEDQKQHIELARSLARRFNHLYGKSFTVPQPLINKETARIMGLDNPLKKMSKSAANSNNYISLTDSPAVIEQKIKKAVTDSGTTIEYDLKRPAIANLMTIYKHFSDLSFDDIEKKYKNKGYAQFKEGLAETIILGLKSFQEKKAALEKNPKKLEKILQEGAKQAKAKAQKTLKEAKQKMG